MKLEVFLGSLLVVVGAMALLKQLGILEFGHLMEMWPGALIGIGVALLFDRPGERAHGN